MSGPARVVSVTVTRRRAALLQRLLESIESNAPLVAEAIVVSDGHDPAAEDAVRRSRRPARYLMLTKGTGQGPGLVVALRTALDDPHASHFLMLDDDAVVPPTSIAALVEAAERHGAGCVVPLLENEGGEIGWYPGVTDRRCRALLKRPGLTRAAFLSEWGESVVPFTWAPWPFLLVTREALQQTGFPRMDFGFSGDDLEWVLRISARFPALLVPAAQGWHWPPPPVSDLAAYDKECLHLQNLCFLSTRLPHGRRAARHLPGAFWRLARRWGARPGVVADMVRAGWSGVICNRPAAGNRSSEFWRRYLEHRGG